MKDFSLFKCGDCLYYEPVARYDAIEDINCKFPITTHYCTIVSTDRALYNYHKSSVSSEDLKKGCQLQK